MHVEGSSVADVLDSVIGTICVITVSVASYARVFRGVVRATV